MTRNCIVRIQIRAKETLELKIRGKVRRERQDLAHELLRKNITEDVLQVDSNDRLLMPAPTALLRRPDELAEAQATPLPRDSKKRKYNFQSCTSDK